MADGGPIIWKSECLSELPLGQEEVANDAKSKTARLRSHDQPRAVSRWGDDSDEHRHASAKLLGLMQMALLGTCFVYQGQELGARNLCTEDYPDEAYQDVQTRYWLDT